MGGIVLFKFFERNYYGTQTKIAVLLEIQYTDGTQTVVKSDETWKTTQNGPIRKCDLKEGEIYDARMELTGWRSNTYKESQWNSAHLSSMQEI